MPTLLFSGNWAGNTRSDRSLFSPVFMTASDSWHVQLLPREAILRFHFLELVSRWCVLFIPILIYLLTAYSFKMIFYLKSDENRHFVCIDFVKHRSLRKLRMIQKKKNMRLFFYSFLTKFNLNVSTFLLWVLRIVNMIMVYVNTL